MTSTQLKSKIAAALAVKQLTTDVLQHEYILSVIREHTHLHDEAYLSQIRSDLGAMMGALSQVIEVIDESYKKKIVYEE